MRLPNAFRAPAVAAAIMLGCAETPPPPPASPPDFYQTQQRSDEAQQQLDTAIGSKGQQVTPGYGPPPAGYPPPPPQWAPVPPGAAAPQSSSGRPSWIERPNERYPDAQYLAAVGAGDEQNAAQD